MVKFCYVRLYLGTETVYCYGWHGLKLEKVRQTFSSFKVIPSKITKTMSWLVLPGEFCLLSSS